MNPSEPSVGSTLVAKALFITERVKFYQFDVSTTSAAYTIN